MQDVDCGRFEEQASDYIENTLAPDEAAALARHLSVCADCRRDEAALRSLYREMSRLPEVEPPLFFRENAIAAIEREQKTRPVAWWNAPAQWSRLTRTAVGATLATGAAFAFAWSVFLPRTNTEAPLQTADVVGVRSTPVATAASPAPPRLHLSRTLTMSATEGPAYDVQMWLTGATQGTARVRLDNDTRDYRVNLSAAQAQPLRVPLSVASDKPIIGLTAQWSAEGQSHTRRLFLPVPTAARNTTAVRQSFGLANLTVVEAAREVSERYGQTITLDDAPDLRVQINARQETALETLTRHLEPLGLSASAGPDGIVIAPREQGDASAAPRP